MRKTRNLERVDSVFERDEDALRIEVTTVTEGGHFGACRVEDVED